jgi:acetylornithine deacetylase
VIPGFDTAPVAYTSDIPLLDRWGTPLLFGPGSIHVAHTVDEHIAVPELRAAVDAYERIVRTLLKS